MPERQMPKIELAGVPIRQGTGYPPPFDAPCAGRTRRCLGEAGGLEDFDLSLGNEGLTAVSADHAEARAAFIQKRKPQFTGE